MLLKYNKTATKNSVAVTLYCSNYSNTELAAIKEIGSPIISLTKIYPKTNTLVSINSVKLYDDFKVTVDFMLQDDNQEPKVITDDLMVDVENFINDIRDIITDKMKTLMTEYANKHTRFCKSDGTIPIDDAPINI